MTPHRKNQLNRTARKLQRIPLLYYCKSKIKFASHTITINTITKKMYSTKYLVFNFTLNKNIRSVLVKFRNTFFFNKKGRSFSLQHFELKRITKLAPMSNKVLRLRFFLR